MRYVIIGQTGDSQLFVVDTVSLSVQRLESESAAPEAIRSLRTEGGAIYRGVDLAIASDTRDDPSGRWFFVND